MEPIILLHLLIFSSRCSIDFNSVSRIKHRCLWLSDILISDWLKKSELGLLCTILGEKQTTIVCFLGSGLKSISHCKAHFLIIVRSSFNSCSDFLKSWHFENKDVSSVNVLQIDLTPSDIWLIYIKKRSARKTDPFGTQERTLSQKGTLRFI